MKLNIHSFSLAGALTVTVWYSTLAFFIKTWPYETFRFISIAYMIPHLENIIPYIKVTPTNIFIGFSIHFVIAYFFFCSIACLYNIFSYSRNK